MLKDFINALWRIRNYERIPKLPRGMLAERYEAIDRPESRVLARLGARSPMGVKIAMREAGAESVPQLVELLSHFKPQHRFRDRLRSMTARFFGALPYHPHGRELVDDRRRARRRKADAVTVGRIDAAKRAFKE